MKKLFASPLFFMALLSLSIALSGCKKDDVDPEIGGPSINVTGPADMTTYTSGDTLKLRGTITDDDELHEYEIKLVRKGQDKMASDSTFYYYSEHKHAKSVSIDRDIKLMVDADSDFELTIKASNHDGKQTQKTIKLHVNPGSAVVDTELPVITISAPTANAEFSPTQTINLRSVITDNVKVKKYRIKLVQVSNGAVLYQDSLDHVGQLSVEVNRDIPLTGIAAGTDLTVVVEAWDKSSNYDTKSVAVKVVSGTPVDNVSPTVTLIAPVSGAMISSGTPVNVQASVSDNVALQSYTLSVTKGGASVFTDTVTLTGTSANIDRDITFTVGMHSDVVVSLTVTDAAGLATTKTANLHVH